MERIYNLYSILKEQIGNYTKYHDQPLTFSLDLAPDSLALSCHLALKSLLFIVEGNIYLLC